MFSARSILTVILIIFASGIIIFSCSNDKLAILSPVANVSDFEVVVWFISTNPNHSFKPMVYSLSSRSDSLLDSFTVSGRWDHICFSADGSMICGTNRLTSIFVGAWPSRDTIGYDRQNLGTGTCFAEDGSFLALNKPCIYRLPQFDLVYADTAGIAGSFIAGNDKYAYICDTGAASCDRLVLVDLRTSPPDTISLPITDKNGIAVRPRSLVASKTGDSLFVTFASDSSGVAIYNFGIYDAATLALLSQFRIGVDLNYKFEAKQSVSGNKIYYRHGWDYGFPGYHGEIYAVDVESGAMTLPVSDVLGTADAPTAMALTPDGKFLYFIVSEERIYRLDLNSGKIEERGMQLKGKGRVKGLGINPIPLDN